MPNEWAIRRVIFGVNFVGDFIGMWVGQGNFVAANFAFYFVITQA